MVRLCATCAARATCAQHGHDYTDPRRGEDGTGGWRACACDRSLREHVDSDPDPAGGPGCGMQWRLCGRCDHIDERHITDDTDSHIDGATARAEGQPGGHFRQDVPAGPVLPNHQMSSEETPMVGPHTAVGGARP